MSDLFEFFTAPRIVFGAGTVDRLGEIVSEHGRKALLVLGGKSADERGLTDTLRSLLPVGAEARCDAEPTVEVVDRAVEEARLGGCDVVVAVGGGSVVDCGKAAAAMATNPGSLVDYLEGVGTGATIDRPPLPFIAVPTTSGTGSEVTKNAVISGPGYKKSVRSPLMIPRVALVDPSLTYGMPRSVTAACGMDALTQLVEAYLSRNAQPLTDALALPGISAVGHSLEVAFREPENAEAREGMALASLLSGICLANAGLGAVHGFAAALGAFKSMAHGVACAALLPQVLRANLAAAAGTPAEERFVHRLATIGSTLVGEPFVSPNEAIDHSLEHIIWLQRRLEIPALRELGVTADDLPVLVKNARGSSMRTNPVDLSDQQLMEILEDAL